MTGGPSSSPLSLLSHIAQLFGLQLVCFIHLIFYFCYDYFWQSNFSFNRLLFVLQSFSLSQHSPVFCFLNEITSQISLRFEFGNFFLLISLLFPSLFLFLLESGFPLSVILSLACGRVSSNGWWLAGDCMHGIGRLPGNSHGWDSP